MLKKEDIINYQKDNRLCVNYTSCNPYLIEDVRHLCDILSIDNRIKGNKVFINNVILFDELISNLLVVKDISKESKKIWKCTKSSDIFRERGKICSSS